MSDLLEQLRAMRFSPPTWLADEAAKEIQLLRTQLATADRRVADMREAAARWHDDMRHRLQNNLAQEQRAERAIAFSHSIQAHQLSAVAIRALPLPDAPEPQGWRHKKQGTVYKEAGHATLQVSTPYPREGDVLMLYRGQDGQLWAREYGEFHDGRFERLPPPPARTAQGDEMPQPGCAPIKSPWGPDDPTISTAQGDAGDLENG